MHQDLVLHEDPLSGNCYKIRLTAALVGVPIERRSYDITKGETRTPDFLERINGNGRIPVLQVGERMLPESNAACIYIAEGSALIPTDRFNHADMMRWLFWEQYNHEPNIATLRYWTRWIGLETLSEAQRAQLPAKRAGGEDALALMDRHLDDRSWFVGDGPGLADVALFAYTHVAEDGGFALARYPNVQAWLRRMAEQPGFVPMSA